MRTLFIDFDGTICHDRFWRSLPASEYEQIQQILFGKDSTRVRDWMCGAYTSEDICAFVAAKTNIPFDHLFETLAYDCSTMYIDPLILATIHELRTTFHTVLITGNMDCFSRYTVPSLHLTKHFDTIVNSADERQLKTDAGGETFQKYLQGNMSESFLIEDSPTTCDVFTALGGTALRVTQDTGTLEHLRTLQTDTP